MDRREELLKLVKPDDVALVSVIVDNIVDLENRIIEIKKLPFVQYDKKNPYKQRQLPASKVYTSLLQQYNLAIKTLHSLIGGETGEDDSPLRAYLKKMMSNA